MPEKKDDQDDFSAEDKKKFAVSSLKQYGIYSGIVFQMLATMGLAFWGGKKLNDHFDISNNLLTIGVGFLGMGLAFYNLLHQLKNVQQKEDEARKK